MHLPRILVTGSSGVVGSALVSALSARHYSVESIDLRSKNSSAQGDICDITQVSQRIRGIDGIVHLAAVSRVVEAENNPDRCWSVNVGGLRNVLHSALALSPQPWLIFASSREVYGQPQVLPADENSPLLPINAYGRSKVEGERLIEEVRKLGMRACTLRLPNVYGSPTDHSDRVIPAFARAALQGQPLKINGSGHTFDFIHVSDVINGILTLTNKLVNSDVPPPPIQLVSGIPTMLGELAEMIIDISESCSEIHLSETNSFEVANFVGVGERAREILKWKTKISLQTGLEKLIADLRGEVRGHPAMGRVA